MADEDFRLKISGDANALKAVFASISGDVRTMTDSVSGSINSINGVFTRFHGALLLIGAVLAGGRIFKAAIDETVKLTAESNKLARSFGINVTQASALRAAIDDLSASQPGLEISTEAMNQTAAQMAKNLGNNEQAFRALGIQTRDTATGGFRPLLDIMFDINARLLNMKDGADRNVAANVLYGRSWRDLQGILGLTREKMEAAREKAERLGLLLGTESAARVVQYKSAMNDFNDTLTATNVLIGESMLPDLTRLAEWFGEVGPPAIEFFSNAIKGLNVVVRTLFFGFKALALVLDAIVKTIYNSLAGGVEAVMKVLRGDFEGAWQALGARGDATAAAWKRAMVDISVDASETAAKIEKILEPKSTAVKPAAGKDTSGGSDIFTDPKEMQARALAAIETRKALALEAVEIEAERIRNMAELNEIEQREALTRLRALEEKKLAIEIEALRAQRAALEKYGANASEIAKVNGQIQAVQAKHGTAMVKINHQITKDILKNWFSMVDALESAFTSTVQKMARGQATFRDLFRNAWNALLDEFIKIQAHILFMHIKGEMAKTAATAEGEATRGALQAAGAEKGLIVLALSKAKEILMAGWSAAANTYAAIAAIPLVGPFLAPAAAIAAAAAVHRMASNLASAAGGWDQVPRDQLAMVHKNEMVLSAPLAERVRAMTDSGRNVIVNNNFNSVYHDRRGIRQLLVDNSGAVAESLRRAVKNNDNNLKPLNK